MRDKWMLQIAQVKNEGRATPSAICHANSHRVLICVWNSISMATLISANSHCYCRPQKIVTRFRIAQNRWMSNFTMQLGHHTGGTGNWQQREKMYPVSCLRIAKNHTHTHTHTHAHTSIPPWFFVVFFPWSQIQWVTIILSQNNTEDMSRSVDLDLFGVFLCVCFVFCFCGTGLF